MLKISARSCSPEPALVSVSLELRHPHDAVLHLDRQGREALARARSAGAEAVVDVEQGAVGGAKDLVFRPGEKPVGKAFEKPYFLFDLERDPSETTNVIEKYPEVAKRLTEQLEAIRQSAGSRMNPRRY